MTAQMRTGIMVVLALSLLAGLGYAVYQRQVGTPATQTDDDAAFAAALDALLQDTVQDMREKMTAYRTQRKIFVALAQPDNLAQPGDAAENYRLMQDGVAAMRREMEAALGVFAQSEAGLRALLAGRSDAERIGALAAWENLKAAQAVPYRAFFASEAAIIDSYLKLMEFYVLKEGHYSLDRDSGQLVFDNPDDQAQEQAYRESIARFTAEQAAVLK